MRGLDRFITGNYGEDQLMSLCVECGRRYDAAERAEELGLDEDMELPDTCSRSCDTAADYKLMAQHEGEDVPKTGQSERDMIENGGWIKGKKRKR